MAVSHEYLDQRIYADKRRGGALWRALRGEKLRRKKYGSGRQLRGRTPIVWVSRLGVDGSKTARSWVAGKATPSSAKKQGFIVTLVERRSGFALVHKVPCKSSAVVSAAVVAMLAPHRAWVVTLTFDNGSEFAGHESNSRELGCAIYFARPYVSWQRGTNENFNGLLRQYLPWHSRLAQVRTTRIGQVENAINGRARKRLNWASPAEVFGVTTGRLGGALAS